MILNQVIQVCDVAEAIKENGIYNYVKRLVQDRFGDYFFVEFERYEKEPDEKPGMMIQRFVDESDFNDPEVCWIQYEIIKLPRSVAFYIIDAMKLKAQVMEIGQGDGEHGGRNRYFIWKGKAKQVPKDEVKVVVVEDI